MMARQGPVQRLWHLVDTLAADTPARPWHDLVAPFLFSIALVSIALLLSLLQMLFDA
jgi:hypothetical protein